MQRRSTTKPPCRFILEIFRDVKFSLKNISILYAGQGCWGSFDRNWTNQPELFAGSSEDTIPNCPASGAAFSALQHPDDLVADHL